MLSRRLLFGNLKSVQNHFHAASYITGSCQMNAGRVFSSQLSVKEQHQKKHSLNLLEETFFENEFIQTSVDEIEFIRSPFYELTKAYKMDFQQCDELLEEIHLKHAMCADMETLGLSSPRLARQSTFPYQRYADESSASKDHKYIFQAPKNEPIKRSFRGELFKFHKADDHWQQVRRSKSYIAEEFFPPIQLRSNDLISVFERQEWQQWAQETEEYMAWREDVMALLPKLGVDAVIELAYYLSFEAKLNDKHMWRAIEEAALTNFHLFDLQKSCQMQWAITQMKPKHTSTRFSNMLFAMALEKVQSGVNSPEEVHLIMQGHRNKSSKDLYMKMRQSLIDRFDVLYKKPKKDASPEEFKKWADQMVNTLFSVYSNMPKHFGVYKQYQKDEIDEVLSHYEHDLCEAAQYLDGDGVTRLSQALYLMKSKSFENIWWRVENRVHELAEQQASLDVYNIANIIRSFSKSQENRMSGSPKLFYHLEPLILANINQIESRHLGQLMYGYSIRAVGNPEIYKAFENRLYQLIDAGEQFDYQFVSNALYYMMFRESKDEKIWKALMDSTIDNDDVLPLMFYRPFKMSRFYLEKAFPEWDLSEYIDKFFYADRYFNPSALDNYLMYDQMYIEFKGFLNRKCLVYPIAFMTLHNTFNLHYVFYDQKIAINFHLKKMCPPFQTEPSEMQKLCQKILKLHGWEVLDLSEQQFKEWKTQEKIDNVKGWLKEAKQRQVEKGFIDAEWKPPI